MNKGYEPLSGTYGYLTFRVINGKAFVREKPEVLLPKHPTEEQKAKRKKRLVIDECVARIQMRNKDIRTAIGEREKIRNRVTWLYTKLSRTIRSRTKLAREILKEYQG